jgi:hypothetical protein
MFRWTCRLRDALEKNRFQISDNDYSSLSGDSERLSTMREVELSLENGAFPASLRWERFMSFYSNGAYERFDLCRKGSPHLSPAIDSKSPLSQSIRALSGRSVVESSEFKFDVLWLSPKVFLSRFSFTIVGNFRFNYAVILNGRGNSGVDPADIDFYAYAISSFGGKSDLGPPSPLPLVFLCHLGATLPADYFSKIWFGSYNRERPLPVGLYEQLLSIIPHTAPRGSANRELTATVVLAGVIERDDLRQILAHQFHPAVKLLFYEKNPFRNLSSLSEFHPLLQESQYLRSIVLPNVLVESNESREIFQSLEATFKLPLLSIHCAGTISIATLKSIYEKYRVTDIKIKLFARSWPDVPSSSQELMNTCIGLFSKKNSLLERACISYVNHIDDSLGWSPGFVSYCSSKVVCFVTVHQDRCYENAQLREIPSCDQSPLVVLNCDRTLLKKNLTSGMIPYAIKAIQDGRVFCMASAHKAFDMSITNAGLTFSILKQHANIQEGLGNLGFNNITLAGKKRPPSP